MSQSRPPLAPLRDQLTSVTLQQPIDQPSSPGQDGDKIRHTPGSGPSIQDLLALAAITIMLVWPWAFCGAVWIRGGVQLSNHMAKVVTKNPHATTYFVTLICSIITMITGALFSLAIIRFAQELVTHRKPTRPFHLRVLLAFRHQNWPWAKSVKGAKYLINRHRWWPAVLLIVCILTFPHLISSTASLLTPIPFNRTADLNGTEIDFSGVNCEGFYNNHALDQNCGYQLYGSLAYTNCLGENQMVDVLESGRGNILELITDNTQSLTFSQLGGDGGLHFLGSIRGVLPNGPNGVPEFNTLNTSFPFSNSKIMAGVASYDYTLNQQGFTSNVSCRYVTTSLINSTSLDNETDAVSYDLGTCANYGMSEVLSGPLQTPWYDNALEYWPCQSTSNAGLLTDSYSIYLVGKGAAYNTTITNITCTLTQIQTAIFPVKYDSTTNIFSAAKETPGSYQAIAFPKLLNWLFTALGEVVTQGQNFQANLVAESVLTFAYKSFNVTPNTPQSFQSSKYLELFEQMIAGIFEYEVSYLRLIYSTIGSRPSYCTRTVTGSANYQVVGWFVSRANIGFLIPITIINGASFVALVLAMWIAWTGGHILHPFHPRPVVLRDDVDEDERVPYEWESHVAYNPTMVMKEYFQKNVADKLKQGAKAAAQGFERAGEGLVAGPSGSHQQDSAPATDRPQHDIAPADDTLQENVAR